MTLETVDTDNTEELARIAPPFDPGKHAPKPEYYWWSWHPRYPYWSKSCWGGESEEYARKQFTHDAHLDYYHNKLIKEEAGVFTEIDDIPCPRLDIWKRCIDIDRANLEREFETKIMN